MRTSTSAVVNLIRWKQQGWVPSRDLILALTADEEVYGDEDGIDWLLKHLIVDQSKGRIL